VVAGTGIGFWAADASSSKRPVGQVVVSPGAAPAAPVSSVGPPTTPPTTVVSATTSDVSHPTTVPLVPVPSAPTDVALPSVSIPGHEDLRLEDGTTVIVASTVDDQPPRYELTIIETHVVSHLEYRGFPFDATRPIEAADVTGDGRDDYLVPLDNNGRASLLVSGDGGAWHLVLTRAIDGSGATSPELGRDPHLVDGVVQVQYDDCVPSCAEGTTTPVRLVYVDGVLEWPS
jgi:hypothetical protein